MCNLYAPPTPERIAKTFGSSGPHASYPATVAPLKPGPFVVADSRTLVGQWGMIPPGSKTHVPTTKAGVRMSTNNARSERMASAWTFRQAWAKGQRCIIPADSFQEPYWGSGYNVWWRFDRADGEPWALAGLWGEWTDPATGEVLPNYTMITQAAEGHPIMGLMHRPGKEKRSVVPLERGAWDAWLHGEPEQAQALIVLPDVGVFKHRHSEGG